MKLVDRQLETVIIRQLLVIRHSFAPKVGWPSRNILIYADGDFYRVQSRSTDEPIHTEKYHLLTRI